MFLTLFDRYRTVKLLILLCFNYKNYSSRVTDFSSTLFPQSDKSLPCHSGGIDSTIKIAFLGSF